MRVSARWKGVAFVVFDFGLESIPFAADPERVHLCVGNNHVNQKRVVMTARKLGFSVAAVNNGQEGLNYLEQPPHGVRTNIVLIDCRMHLLDSYGVNSRIRSNANGKFSEELRKIPIIALTASAIKGDKEKCQEAGINDYLSKPIWRDIIERVLVNYGRTIPLDSITYQLYLADLSVQPEIFESMILCQTASSRALDPLHEDEHLGDPNLILHYPIPLR